MSHQTITFLVLGAAVALFIWDRLPVATGTRYELTLPGGQPVNLFDTSGYGERVSDADFAAAVEASRDADLILLVTPAMNPGRANDIDLLDRLKAWFAQKPHLRLPAGPGVRWDSHVHEGYLVGPNYDSLIGKLIVHRESREQSIRTMQRALAEFEVEGIKTTIPLLRKILAHPDFAEGRVDTTFVERTWGGK